MSRALIRGRQSQSSRFRIAEARARVGAKETIVAAAAAAPLVTVSGLA
jgi:hypothetical protein